MQFTNQQNAPREQIALLKSSVERLGESFASVRAAVDESETSDKEAPSSPVSHPLVRQLSPIADTVYLPVITS